MLGIIATLADILWVLAILLIIIYLFFKTDFVKYRTNEEKSEWEMKEIKKEIISAGDKKVFLSVYMPVYNINDREYKYHIVNMSIN